MKQNYSHIHCLRVVATLAIILLHTATGGVFEEFKLHGGLSPYISLIYKHSQEWAVPAFVLISGTIFLSPHKEINYNILFKKYIKRIALAILIFGLPMTFSEIFLSEKGSSIPTIIFASITNWLSGYSWAHMWYLYMLIGLYLITPIIKPFLSQANNKDIRTALIVMFIISSILPTLKSYDFQITGYMIITTPFIFIYMLGYYLQWRINYEKKLQNKILCFIVLGISLASIIIRICCNVNLYGYYDPACILMAASIFILFKQYDTKSSIAEKLSPYCFCVYLTHTIFINASYKILHITPLNILGDTPLSITIPIFFAIFTILSFASPYFLIKIPFLKKHVL